MFDEAWGVDVAVSTPRLMTALVEEAVSIGDLVRVFEFRQAKSAMVEMTLPPTSPYAGARVGDIPWPEDTVLVGIIREGRPIAPSRDDALEPQDELLFIAARTMEDNLENLLSPATCRAARMRTTTTSDDTRRTVEGRTSPHAAQSSVASAAALLGASSGVCPRSSRSAPAPTASRYAGQPSTSLATPSASTAPCR